MHFAISAAAVAALASSGTAHMIMSNPPSYSGKQLVQVNPLDGKEFLYPCQYGTEASAYNTGYKSTPMKAGGSQLVQFNGAAVHGGGSCEFSVTYNWPPSADPSTWHVIHAIEGGCPAEAEGNLQVNGKDADGRVSGPQCGNDSGKECVRQFNIPVPSKMKNGKASFAWTWFNKIGNREMYMNCAPVEISGGVDDDSFVKTLPPMFVANYPGKCTTSNGILGFPNPGQSLVKNDPVTAGSQGTCPAPNSSSSSSSGGSDSPSPSGGSYPPASTSGGIFAPSPSSAPPATTLVSAPAPSVPATSAPSAPEPSSPAPYSSAPAPSAPAPSAPAPAPAPSSYPSGGQSGQTVSCPTDGAIFCISATQFGLCNRGSAIPQDVAAGTQCVNGSISAISTRRRRHARAHRHNYDQSF